MRILLADKQDITRMGLVHIVLDMNANELDSIPTLEWKYVEDKAEMMFALTDDDEAVVVLDYTLFDINDAEELLILCQRFSHTRWLLFSEDLSVDFVRVLIASSSQISILTKDSQLSEIRAAIKYCIQDRRFICQHMTEVLLAPPPVKAVEKVNLTKTETEILKDIALGMTTKEIAEKRFSSFHTVNTHRKNIFRKLDVNNAHEATKYALRAGLIDSAEYYI